jgi:hypothetical protein
MDLYEAAQCKSDTPRGLARALANVHVRVHVSNSRYTRAQLEGCEQQAQRQGLAQARCCCACLSSLDPSRGRETRGFSAVMRAAVQR